MYFPFFFGHEFLTVDKDGIRKKDLKRINRDPRKIVAIDHENSFLSTSNAFKISEYHGSDNDKEIKYLTIFLNHLASNKVKDIRKEIKKYGGFDNAFENFK